MAHSDETSRTRSESEESDRESQEKIAMVRMKRCLAMTLKIIVFTTDGTTTDAVEVSQQSRTEKFEKYLKEDMPEDRAREKAYARTVWAIKNNFFDSFGTFLEQIQLIQKDKTYQDILSDIEEKVEGGMDVRKAVKRILPKHKHKFESLFEFDPDVVEDDNQESDGHDSVDAELPSRVPGY